jgi:threonine/homoserine/homoserine lactone efflux protein
MVISERKARAWRSPRSRNPVAAKPYACPVPETTALLSFMVLALVVIVVPGPSVVFVIGRAMILGTKGAVLSVLGNAIGVGVQIVAVALGVGAVVSSSPVLFGIVKVVGAGFLVYLGVEGIRHRKLFAEGQDTARVASTARLLRESSVVGITNAKTLVFFIAAFPLFVDPLRGSVIIQMLILGAFFWVVGIASDLVWAVAAGSARAWLSRSASRLEWVRIGGGTALIALGFYLGFYSLSGAS